MQIKEKITLLPTLPGVYQFLDKDGQVIYVGKAKNLRSRVSSYFVSKNDHSIKVRTLVKHIVDLRHTVVDTESDALLLENNLIKEIQPRYNILLKDSKTYPWICITNEQFPRIFSTRILNRKLGQYYGPYSSLIMQRAILELIRSLYPIRSCHLKLNNDSIAAGKFDSCLEYHIHNCMAPCIGKEDSAQYLEHIAGARELLKGDFVHVKVQLVVQMHAEAAKMNFEKAERIKKKLLILENYSYRSIIVSPTINNVDVINLLQDQSGTFCNRLRVQHGAIIESYTFELKAQLDETPEELLTFAISNMPTLQKELVLPFMPTFQNPAHIYTMAMRGDKAKLLELSLKNCKLYQIERLKYIEKTDPDRHTARIMDKMKQELVMDIEPKHIECFDNSNIQGTNPVASCVVFKDGKPSKKDYRHYNIKTVVGANDFASMQEIVYRRYHRLVAQGEELPQLIVIDGGKGQLAAAVNALKELNLMSEIKILGLAKRLEEVFFANDPEPRFLDKRGETLRILMHIRDEAHRFGITFHRQKRSIAFLKSELEEVEGLGKVSIEKLIKKYHTISRMSKISLEELANLIGNGRAVALKGWLEGYTSQKSTL